MKSTTAQSIKSEEKLALTEISVRELNAFLAEDDEGITKQRKILDKAYEKALDGDGKLLEWFLNKTYGRPAYETDVTSKGEKIESISVEIIRPNAS